MASLRNLVLLVTATSALTMNAAMAGGLNDSWRNTTSSENTFPLVSISLGAASQTVNSYSFDITAVVNTWSLNTAYEPVFSSHRVEFALQPGQRETLVTKGMKVKDKVTPQALLDKMLIDGALTLNLQW